MNGSETRTTSISAAVMRDITTLAESTSSGRQSLVADELTVLHGDQPVGSCRDRRVVRDEDERQPFLVQLGEQVHHRGRHLRVEVPGGLVRPDEPGPAGESARDRDTLLLTAGELGWPPVEPVPEPDPCERLARPLPRLGFGDVGEQERQLDVLGRREDRDQVERLEDEAHRLGAMPGSPGIRELVDRVSLDDHPSVVDLIEAGQAVEQCGLSRAGRTHHGEELALRHGEVEALEGKDVGPRRPVDLADALGDENWPRHEVTSCENR